MSSFAAAAAAAAAAANVTKWAAENPALTVCAIVGAAGVGIAAAPAIVSLPVLSAIGFGAGGVQAGTTAAVIHAGIGNVAAGAPFAICQSAATGGLGLAKVNGIAQVGGVAMAAGGGAVAWLKSKL